MPKAHGASGGGGGGGGNPGGLDTAVQFNNAGSFGGDASKFAFNDGTGVVSLNGQLEISGGTAFAPAIAYQDSLGHWDSGIWYDAVNDILCFETKGIEDVAINVGGVGFLTSAAGLTYKIGLNARAGLATLITGSAVVANTSVTANSFIKYWVQSVGGVQGILSVAITAGVGFTLNSTSDIESSVIAWEISELTTFGVSGGVPSSGPGTILDGGSP